MLKKTFVPNMSPDMVRELDRRRGMGDQGKFMQPDAAPKRQPWQEPFPGNKLDDEKTYRDAEKDNQQKDPFMSVQEAIKALKAVADKMDLFKPEPSRSEGESNDDYMSRLVSFYVKEGKEQDQAVAIAGKQAGVYKSMKKNVISSAPHPSMAAKPVTSGGGTGQIMGQKPKPPSLTPRGQSALSAVPLKSMGEKEESPHDEAMEGEHSEPLEHADACEACKAGTCKAHACKALTSRSPIAGYVASREDDIFRSATTVSTRRFSRLQSPEGVAPLVGETLREVAERDRFKKHAEYERCGNHGMMYKSDSSCQLCNVAKANMCLKCNTHLIKQNGGYVCPKGHDLNE